MQKKFKIKNIDIKFDYFIDKNNFAFIPIPTFIFHKDDDSKIIGVGWLVFTIEIEF